jgi:hypothetical protein
MGLQRRLEPAVGDPLAAVHPPGAGAELTVLQATGNDLSWVAGPGGVHGYQPITSINSSGDYPGVTPMSPPGH